MGKALLKPCDFTVASGKMLLVAGPNGAGKSTLLRMAAGVWPATTGRVVRAKRIAWVPDGIDGFAWLTIREWGLAWVPNEAKLKSIWEKLEILSQVSKPLGKCSRGTRQKALLSPFLAVPPDLLILDEPVATLDPSSGQAVLKLLRGLGCAVVFSCHLGRVAPGLADDYLILHDGDILARGSAVGGLDVEAIYLELGL
jgi:ABC-type multidrug transport system ATPase subunit